MAEGADREARTEEPTERRLSDAIERGQVPVARELVTLGSLFGLLAATALYAGQGSLAVATTLRSLLAGAGEFRLAGQEDAWLLMTALAWQVAAGLAPFLAAAAAGGIVASLIQNAPQMAVERIKPQVARISPAAGWKRLFGQQGLGEFAKSLFKFAAVALAVAVTAKALLGPTLATLASDPMTVPRTVLDMTLRILWVLVVIAAVLAAADLAWSRFKWRKDLRMTRQEIKDEHKQQEGDPAIKFKVRALARQRSSRRLAQSVPRATMVVTNPTHYAVALRYVGGETAAPMVVAKGADHLAQKIRELAKACDIPLVENKPLARALYEKVPVDGMIPAEFYKAVAEIIHFLQLRKTRRR